MLNDGKSLTNFTGFSLRWYEHMLKSKDMMEALYTTFSIACHNHRDGASEIPFSYGNELILNHIPNQEVLSAICL